ncbi:hypothetical protein RIF29_08596 [Crotalaria pallida]|uniref:Uncharacterized protein n=1 Tax=Crotalaria pallida TaxID=3830 RepID=A0AAN9FTX2_CROPI
MMSRFEAWLAGSRDFSQDRTIVRTRAKRDSLPMWWNRCAERRIGEIVRSPRPWCSSWCKEVNRWEKYKMGDLEIDGDCRYSHLSVILVFGSSLHLVNNVVYQYAISCNHSPSVILVFGSSLHLVNNVVYQYAISCNRSPGLGDAGPDVGGAADYDDAPSGGSDAGPKIEEVD